MAREPNWTECEFTTLLYRPELDHKPLAQIIRSPGAIEVVREGVHTWHKEGRNPGRILNNMMVHLLEDKGRLRTQCWKCKEWF